MPFFNDKTTDHGNSNCKFLPCQKLDKQRLNVNYNVKLQISYRLTKINFEKKAINYILYLKESVYFI